MATIPLMNPFETRVLPALPRVEQRAEQTAAPKAQARLRLVLSLHADEQLEVWDDRIVTPDQVYTLDSFFDARVTTDWRAPLTVEPEMGLAFLDQRRRWNLYIPADEAQIWHAAYVLRAVCEARGLALANLSASAEQIQSWGSPIAAAPELWEAHPAAPEPITAAHPYAQIYAPAAAAAVAAAHPYVPAWGASEGSLAGRLPPRAAMQTPSDTVLMAIAHLSVLFMPALLPLAIWIALRHNMPRVATQAREAMRFQLGVGVLALALLGYAGYSAVLHGVSGGATLGLLGFVVLVSASVVYAFHAAIQSAHGRDFLYFGFFR